MKASTLRAATRRQSDLTTRVSAIERAAQSSYRSIEAGAMTVYDEDGKPVQSIGIGVDGSVGVQDLIDTDPSAPTDVTVAAGTESLQVRWDGEYVDDQPAGVTVAYVAVHASQDAADEWDESTEVAQLPAVGGILSIPADSDVETTVVLIAVSAAGVWSEPSEEITATPLYYNSDLEDLVVEFEQDLVAAQEAIVQQALGIAAAAADAASALGAATTAQTTANGKNTVTYSTSAPTGATNGNFTPAVAGDVWFRRSGAVIIGQWEFVPGTGWVSRSVDGALVANFDAAYITTGFIDVASRVKAGSIATQLLAVTGANVFPDPEFQNLDWLVVNGTGGTASPYGRFGNGTGWDYYTAGNGARAVRYTVPAGAADGYFNVFPTLSGASQAKDGWLPVEQDSTYLLRFAHFKTATRFKVYANWVKADGTTGGTDFICREDGTAWVTAGGNTTTFRSYILAVPAGVTRIAVRVQIQGTAGQTWAMYGQGITLSRMGDGTLLVDGSITAPKLAVGAMTAKIVEGDVMVFGVPGGQRIQGSTAGLAAYNAANALTAALSAASGGLNLTGKLNVAPTGTVEVGDASNYVRLSTATVGGTDVAGGLTARGSLLFGGSTYERPAEIYALTGSGDVGSLFINSPASVGSANRTYMMLEAAVGSLPGAIRTNAGAINFSQSVTMTAGSPGNPRALWLASYGNIRLIPDGDLQLETAGGYITSTQIYDFASSATPNLVINATTKRIHRNSSSLRYKADVQDIDIPHDLALRLRPRTWLDKGEIERYYVMGGDEPEPIRYPGFIAEEVLAAGGDIFVAFHEGEAESLHYDRMLAAAVLTLQWLAAENERLDGRVAALEGAPA